MFLECEVSLLKLLYLYLIYYYFLISGDNMMSMMMSSANLRVVTS